VISMQTLQAQTTKTIDPELAPQPVRAESVEQESPSTLNVFTSIGKHKLLALVAFLIVLAMGLVMAYMKGKPQYEATAVIYVSPKFVANLEDAKEFDFPSNSQYREYVQQNVRTINRFDIVQRALERLGTNKQAWLLPGEPLAHATERLQAALTIEPVPDTYQISVSLDGGKKQGLAEIVNSVVDTFLATTRQEGFYDSDERIRNLQAERSRLMTDISVKQKQKAALAEQLGVSTFSDGFPNPYDRLLVDAKTALASTRRQRVQAEAAFTALSGVDKQTGVSQLEAYALELTDKDPGLTTLDANLNARRSALLTSISGLSTEHPGRKAAEKELATLQAERDRVFNKLLTSYSAMIRGQRAADVQKQSLTESSLANEVAAQAAQASTFSRGYQDAMGLGAEVDRERKRVDSIEERLSLLSLESRAPGFVRLFSAARDPNEPVKGSRSRYALIAVFLALAVGIFAPLGADYLDPRINSPDDVRRIIGFPVLGWLLDKQHAGNDFGREQVLRIANRIHQERQINGSQIFAFTAVKAKNGTTTLVREVAQALTHLGASALAVEANAYRADPKYRSPKSRGLTVILRGQSDIAHEIVRGDDAEPDFLPVGDVHDFENLPDLQNLGEVLKSATSVYSTVLVDLPPVLASVDAELIARLADVVLLVIEAEAVTKNELRQAAKSLERIKPKAIAAVLNRVHLDAGAAVGRKARDEFYSGAVNKSSTYWISPWLWK
jgi:polysaccharide biosynthesis transport protein